MAHVAPVVDLDSPENEPPEQPYHQAIWPLILLAGVMVGVGFYSALNLGDAYEFKLAPKPLPEVSTDLPGPLLYIGMENGLARAPSANEDSTYRISQTSRAGAGKDAVGMQGSFRTNGLFMKVRYQQEFKEPRVLLWQGDVSKPVALNVSIQIERILADARATFELSPQGALTEYTWTSALNPQLRPTFALFADAHVLLSPRFRQGELRVGDSWTYSLPWAGDVSKLSTNASITMKMTYKGVTEDPKPRAIIAVDVSTTGEVGDSTSVEGKGKGILELYVDAEGQSGVGRFARFAFTLTQTLTRKGESTLTEFAFERVASASPEVGKE